MNYLTKRDVMARLQVSQPTIDRAIRSKKLAIIKIGRLVRITEDSFQNYIKMAGMKGGNNVSL